MLTNSPLSQGFGVDDIPSGQGVLRRHARGSRRRDRRRTAVAPGWERLLGAGLHQARPRAGRAHDPELPRRRHRGDRGPAHEGRRHVRALRRGADQDEREGHRPSRPVAGLVPGSCRQHPVGPPGIAISHPSAAAARTGRRCCRRGRAPWRSAGPRRHPTARGDLGTGRDQLSIGGVHVGRIRTRECQPDPVTPDGGVQPGVERANGVGCIPGDPQPARQRRLHVRFLVRLRREFEPEPAIERE